MIETPTQDVEFVDEEPLDVVEEMETSAGLEDDIDTDGFNEVKNFWTSNMREGGF